jgi:DNA-binding transcriptional ArsR family regulator
MSQRDRKGVTERREHAVAFAALGDETRLALVARLGDGRPASISQLTDAQRTEGAKLTRQAITKHLRVLERARLVHRVRAGRESLFELDPKPMEELKEYLTLVSEQWDQALGRLKAFVEE